MLPGDLVLPDGTPIPRVCHVPPSYHHTVGLDAIDVAESAGLTLDHWQQLVIQLGLAKNDAGKWASFQVALIVSRQNGKGSVLEALELYWLFVSEEPLIGHSAHEYRTAMEAFRRVLFWITNCDWMRKKVKRVINANGEEGIELLSGQRLRFIARSKGAGRGFTFHKIVWDEAYALTNEQVDAQLPTLSAVPDPQIWLTSSPPLDPSTGAALFKLKHAAEAGKDGLTFLDYGAEGSLDALEDIALDDREIWKRTNPAYGIRISMATIERERTALSDAGFARERLGVWPPDLSAGFTVITKEQWNRLCVPDSQAEGRPAISIDVSPRNMGQVKASIGLASRRADGRSHIELIKSGPGSSWLIPDVVTLVQKTNCWVVVDPGSPAGSLLPDLNAAIDPELIVTMSTRDVAQAFGMIYDAATGSAQEEPSVVHIGQPELDAAVAGAGKRPVGDGHAWDRRNATVNITSLVAVTQALWGLITKGSEPEPVLPWVAYA